MLQLHIHCSPIAETSESHKPRGDLTLLSILQSARVSLIVLKLRGIQLWIPFPILLEVVLVVAPLGTLGALALAITHGVLVVVNAEVVLQVLLVVLVVVVATGLGAPVVTALADAPVHPKQHVRPLLLLQDAGEGEVGLLLAEGREGPPRRLGRGSCGAIVPGLGSSRSRWGRIWARVRLGAGPIAPAPAPLRIFCHGGEQGRRRPRGAHYTCITSMLTSIKHDV